MSICLDEGLLPDSRMTIDQVWVDNKAQPRRKWGEQFASLKKFAPPQD